MIYIILYKQRYLEIKSGIKEIWQIDIQTVVICKEKEMATITIMRV